MKGIDRVNAVQVEPDHDRPDITGMGAILFIREKQATGSSRDTRETNAVL